MKVIPAINVTTRDEAKKYILRSAELLKSINKEERFIHIDIVDGKFAKNTTWGSPSELLEIFRENPSLRGIYFEIHLMVVNPESVIESWLKTGIVKKVIVQNETLTDYRTALGKCSGHGAVLMISSAPESSVEKLLPCAGEVGHFQILSVPPGFSGQTFLESSLEKIKFLRHRVPNATIEVDGGVTLEVAKKVKLAGADEIVSANYLLKSENPAKIFDLLSAI